ncbi:M48 family metallopeptidase [Sphingomonas sp. AOB5]|uniref:M48 family metallopeptidase n=1 Tax=Sphingomonas sp. AOB5 TaxID=3034017 RepID=UPI0023F64B09|nr:M48 family metallopeptidase [Sphingomonas sp. AOB5]MDF7774428.1 M48 family metallopeptidase [Sphingomonas sp. AOB5]
MRRYPLLLAAIFLATATDSLATAAEPEGLRAQQHFDQILTGIGYRLATHGGDLCDRQVPLPGFTIHDLSQYAGSQQDEARTTFGFTDAPLILTIAPASPAAAAGLRTDDAIVKIDGRPLPAAPPGARKSYDRMSVLLGLIDDAAADRTLDLEIRRDSRAMTLRILAPLGCASRFQTAINPSARSRADGTYVEITTGMMGFAGTEEQIAAVIAHEMAHNILRHRERLDAKGIRRGMLGQFGRSARLVRQTEIEADRLSVYLMDRAGYDPQAIVTFWERFGKWNPLGFLDAPTHQSPRDRIELITAEIARIARMKVAGQSPRPEFMTGNRLPELR